MDSILSVIAFCFVSLLAVIGWVMYFRNKKIVKQYIPYVVEVEKIQVGFDDICLDFVQALLVRGKTSGAKRLLDDDRLNLSCQENKLYYYLLRIVYNFSVKNVKEGRKWIEYTQKLYHSTDKAIVFEKDINKITHYVNEAIKDNEDRELVHDVVSLLKENIDIEQFDRRYRVHLEKKTKQIQNKSKGFMSNNTQISKLSGK